MGNRQSRRCTDPSCCDPADDCYASRCPVYDYLSFNELREIHHLIRCYCSQSGKWSKEFIILFIFTFIYFLIALYMFFYILNNLQIRFNDSGILFFGSFSCNNVWCMLKPRRADIVPCKVIPF